MRKYSVKTDSYNNISSADSQALASLHQEMQHSAGKGAGVANDTLYAELEMRYGGGFAQWIVDRMNAVISKENA